MRLKDKVAIITGAAQGIGEGIARRFALEGASVVICDLNEDEIKRVEGAINEQGGTALGIRADVTERTQVEEMVRQTRERFGTVDILVNNAGVTRDAMIHKMSEENWDTVIKVNLKGSFNCLQAVAGLMREKGYGKIVNISSISRFGNVGQANYAASKAGIIGMTRAAARELGGKGVTVNAVAPGSIVTEMFMKTPENIRELAKLITPLGRWGTVEEVANVCLFLASDESSYVTGQCIHCDGGMFMP
ncbi:MAG: 3-oxoacyl-ACP reductase FabG [Candidatus Saccharibacteria bacterium]